MALERKYFGVVTSRESTAVDGQKLRRSRPSVRCGARVGGWKKENRDGRRGDVMENFPELLRAWIFSSRSRHGYHHMRDLEAVVSCMTLVRSTGKLERSLAANTIHINE